MLHNDDRRYGVIGFSLVLIITLVGLFYFIGQIDRSSSVGPRSYDMGLILWTPYGEKTPDDIARLGVGLTLDNSEHILVQVPWSAYESSALEKVTWMSEIAIEHERGLTIALDWMDKDRTNLLHTRGKEWSFKDRNVTEKFILEVSEIAAKYKPNYFILGVEVDFLARKHSDEFRYFIDLYKRAYKIIKKQSPKTQVTVTFQFEATMSMHEDKISFPSEPVVVAFGPLLDTIGLAVYPCQMVSHPDELPIDYFTSVIPPNTPVAIFETGWPVNDYNKYDETSQADYLGWLLGVASTVSIDPLIWVSTIDSKNSKEEDTRLETNPCSSVVSHWSQYIGLWDNTGKGKLATNTWKLWLKKAPRIMESHEEATKDQIDRITKPAY